MKILIESAIKLEKDQQTEIEKTLQSKGSEFSYKVNPDILGGLRVTLGGKRIDLSLAGKVGQVNKMIS